MKLLAKIWQQIMAIILVASGIIKRYIVPVIQFLQIVKHLTLGDEDISDALIKELIRKVFPHSSKDILRLMSAFVAAVYELLPAEVFSGLDKRSFYQTVTAVIKYFRTLPSQKLLYTYLLMIGSRMFIILYGKPMHSTEALFFTQLGYTYLKRKNKLVTLA